MGRGAAAHIHPRAWLSSYLLSSERVLSGPTPAPGSASSLSSGNMQGVSGTLMATHWCGPAAHPTDPGSPPERGAAFNVRGPAAFHPGLAVPARLRHLLHRGQVWAPPLPAAFPGCLLWHPEASLPALCGCCVGAPVILCPCSKCQSERSGQEGGSPSSPLWLTLSPTPGD